jgi:hypothetical protein
MISHGTVIALPEELVVHLGFSVLGLIHKCFRQGTYCMAHI